MIVLLYIEEEKKKANNMPDVQSISSAGIVLNGSEILLSRLGMYLLLNKRGFSVKINASKTDFLF